MSIIKKCDVKTYFSERKLKGVHPLPPVTNFPEETSPIVPRLATKTDEPVFVDDFSLEHSSPGGTVTAVVIATASDGNQLPTVPSTPDV